MIANRNFEHCEPITWVGQVPVYLATVLAAVQGVAMILTALASAISAGWYDALFAFTPFYALREFRLWQFFTYSAVIEPGIWNAVSIVMLAIFGRDVEKFLGRRSFGWLYALVLLAAPVILSAFALLGVPVGPMAGTNLLNFAIFIAFVLIYPTAEIFFSIQAKWIGIAAIGIYTLQMMAGQSWVSLAVMWGSCFVGALWIAREGVASVSCLAIQSLAQFIRERRPRRNLRVVPREKPQEDIESIDPILDKIARQGIASLTKAEREKLERARAALLDKERSR
ncbi:MAG: hypothetical protein BGO12_04485 [Verrucomicrobia bacterium 61-8]|nr:MAG: hypothetical protein BGO12_04485 [Verrucomicrobia bacterium 61-8]